MIFSRDDLLKDPEAMLDLIESLYAEIKLLKAQLGALTSPHISSSKKIFSGNQSGLPKVKTTRKRGGKKKGKERITWKKKVPDHVIHSYVKICQNCKKEDSKENQEITYIKRIFEISEKITMELQEHHIYKNTCSCGEVTQARDPTIAGTAFGINCLAFLTSARSHTVLVLRIYPN